MGSDTPPLLSTRARTQTTSAIRELLEHATRPGMISLAGGLPDPGLFPTERLAAIAAQTIRERGDEVLQYGLTAGDLAFREHLALTTPAATGADEVLVTTGSQQALHLLGAALIDPGDPIVVGDPDYLGALQAFRGADAALVPVPVDVSGLVVEDLAARLVAGLRPKLVYVVPHFHNPTGATLSQDRRRALLDLADRYGFVVVFDDPYRELAVGGPPTEPEPHAMAVHLRTVSKVLAPGLRVGWVIGPRWLLHAVEGAKQAADLHTSSLSQAIAHAAMTAPWFPTHIEQLRTATRIKRDVLLDAIAARFGDRLSCTAPEGGMFAWATFADHTDTTLLLPSALDRGVAFVPGDAFSVAADLRRRLRLSWATATPDELDEAIGRLHNAHATLVSA
ncbi:MAG: PLP-dependent aminotransferase family protein [Actinomycetota bacterium]